MKLVHYSRSQGLTRLDPNFMGSGVGGADMKRGIPEVKRIYYYKEGTEPEDVVTSGAQSKYTSRLEPYHKIYDLANDHEGHINKSKEANHGAWNSDDILGRIRDAGYYGFHNSGSQLPNVIALFHAHPVDQEEPAFPNMVKSESRPQTLEELKDLLESDDDVECIEIPDHLVILNSGNW